MKENVVMYAIDRIFRARLSPWHYAARKRVKERMPLLDEWLSWDVRECIIERLVGESVVTKKTGTPEREEGLIMICPLIFLYFIQILIFLRGLLKFLSVSDFFLEDVESF